MGFKRLITTFGLKVKKHSPEILMAAGTVMVLGGVTWACKSSMDVADKVKETKENIDEIKQSGKDQVITEKEANKRVRKEWVECARVCAVKFVGPAALIGGGIFCTYKAKHIMGKRLDGAAAACALWQNKYNTLAENVKKEYGEKEFERLQYGIETRTAEIVRTDPETGDAVSSTETFDGVVDIGKVGKFTLVFDHNSMCHFTDTLHNEDLLRRSENIFSQRLQRNGILWLSDVMKELDIRPKTPEEATLSRLICWTYDLKDKNKDNCVKLRFKQLYDGSTLNQELGYNPVYILDPNYDTNINQDWFKYIK